MAHDDFDCGALEFSLPLSFSMAVVIVAQPIPANWIVYHCQLVERVVALSYQKIWERQLLSKMVGRCSRVFWGIVCQPCDVNTSEQWHESWGGWELGLEPNLTSNRIRTDNGPPSRPGSSRQHASPNVRPLKGWQMFPGALQDRFSICNYGNNDTEVDSGVVNHSLSDFSLTVSPHSLTLFIFLLCVSVIRTETVTFCLTFLYYLPCLVAFMWWF